MRTRNHQRGNVLLLTALVLTVLTGFAGLAVDMGMLRYDKRLQQTAADAAAIAAASKIAYGGWLADGQSAATANGFADGSGNNLGSCTGAAIGTICVEIDSPPLDGPHVKDGNYAEARVAEVWPTYFMNLLGIHNAEMLARAVATSTSGITPGGGGCVYTLGNPAKGIGININGSATLNASSCGIEDNGNFTTNGNALRVSAGSFAVVGSWTDKGTSSGDVTCSAVQTHCPQTDTQPGPNPDAGLPTPCSLGYMCTGGSALSANSTTTVNPGTYTSISLSGNGTVTFNSGVYIINGSGGFSCSGTPVISGTGVMFYFTGTATYNCQGNDNITLTAPTTTPTNNCSSCPSQYSGILMYQDPSDTKDASIGGNVGSAYNGVLYFPSSDLTFYGNSKTNLCGDSTQVTSVGEIVSQSISFSGNPTICMEGPVGLQNQGITVSSITTAILVE